MRDQILVKLYLGHSKNWGDALGPELARIISGKEVVAVNLREKNTHAPIYLTVGSILDNADEKTVVWGSGFIDENQHTMGKPIAVKAVRGPLSRQKLLEQDIDCPEIYGDPALLFPRFYYPKIAKKYQLGIIPHYKDKNNSWIEKMSKIEGVKILDIESGIYNFIDELLGCEKIASSSLHGIIAADAYDIPSLWIELSDKVIGHGFKFRDYFLSVGRKDTEPLVVKDDTTLEHIHDNFYDYKIEIDLDQLYEACPFRPELLS